MDNDSKLRQASKIAKDVRADRGHAAKNEKGYDREDGSRVFTVGIDVHSPAEQQEPSPNPHQAGSEGLEVQLQRHRNDGGYAGNLDNVDSRMRPRL